MSINKPCTMLLPHEPTVMSLVCSVRAHAKSPQGKPGKPALLAAPLLESLPVVIAQTLHKTAVFTELL